ncbi:hypothetical protein HYT91_00210 [Candidatus Pacearchaeota archaeon]|nr:hypothetical protein [Candidatus Pacearchaeota archaeon]
MPKKQVLIAKSNNLNLENLADKEVGKFSLNGLTSRSKIIFSNMTGLINNRNSLTFKERLYLAVYEKAIKKKANIVAIEKEGINSVKAFFIQLLKIYFILRTYSRVKIIFIAPMKDMFYFIESVEFF